MKCPACISIQSFRVEHVQQDVNPSESARRVRMKIENCVHAFFLRAPVESFFLRLGFAVFAFDLKPLPRANGVVRLRFDRFIFVESSADVALAPEVPVSLPAATQCFFRDNASCISFVRGRRTLLDRLRRR